MKRVVTLTFVVMCVFAGAILAQEVPKTPEPRPEEKRLAYFVGRWTREGEMKQSPFGPAGKFSTADHNYWLPGHFFLVLRSAGKGPIGPINELTVMGYSAEEKAYTYDTFENTGEHEVSKGTVQGDTWTWTSQFEVQGKTIKARFMIQEVSPKMYTFKYDFSTDGGSTWTNTAEGEALKMK